MYRAFKRTWWEENRNWPRGLEPSMGKKKYFEEVFETQEEARAFCREWNEQNGPGRYSLKAEFEKVTAGDF